MIQLFKKNLRKILIWCGGIAALYVIQHSFSVERPDFIEEYEIITWNELSEAFGTICVLLACIRLSSNKPFWRKDIDDQQIRIETCEKKLTNWDNTINGVANIIDKKFEEGRKAHETLTTKIRVLEEEQKRLYSLLSDHIWDCYEKWKCNECGETSEDIVLDSSGEGFCEKCKMPAYFDNVKQSWHTIRKSKKKT